jgi:hypothetical protein
MKTKELRVKLYPMKRVALQAIKLLQPPMPQRAENPFATHLPVLAGLGRLFDIRRVLELGAGEHSTLTFLNKDVFPNVEEVRSLETDQVWRNSVAAMANGDDRLCITVTDGPMRDAVAKLDISSFDLIFIDDSLTAADRAATIRQVAEMCGDRSLIAIHDFEVPQYRAAASRFLNRFACTALNPQTGLVWQRANIEVQAIKRLNEVLKKHSSELEPNDLEGWSTALDDAVGWLRNGPHNRAGVGPRRRIEEAR